MNVRRISQGRGTLVACAIALAWAAGTVHADEPEHATRAPPTKEMREKMAAAHDKMAVCLRSDRAIEDCHAEMMKNHDTMMHHHEMTDGSASEPQQK